MYSLASERVAAGGSLSLVNYFAEWCGLEAGDITGHWDAGHKLQLVFGDSIKDNPAVTDFNTRMYSIMFTYNSGKASVKFHKKADDLKQATLLFSNY